MDNQTYEVTFILGEKALEEDAKSKVAELKGVLEQLGGQVTREELWGRRELAYQIKRNRTGFYTTLWFTGPTTAVQPLERHMRFDESIIRSLVTKAYTEAQEGSLYPVAEEEKTDKRGGRQQDEKASAEEMLRRSSGTTPAKKQDDASADAIPEEERLKKLDETLEELLKDEA